MTDVITVLRCAPRLVMTKIHTRQPDGSFETTPYQLAKHFALEQIPVADVIELGQALERLCHDPRATVIRGEPLPGINRARCRRLDHDKVDQDGALADRTFEDAARHWLALDFDGLPLPVWDPADLARRREAIERDRLEHPINQLPPKGPSDGEDYDFDADQDPAPINYQDWCLLIRGAVSTLPAEFEPCHAWFQFTSGHGLKAGINLRLWYWCERPVTDAEAKRWLAGSPVDLALFDAVQVHYVARPIFDPPEADPVERRTGMWWRHQGAVTVPPLPEPPAPAPVVAPAMRAYGTAEPALERRARAYADAVLKSIAGAGEHARHPAMRGGAIVLYQMADAGLLDLGEVTRSLLAIAESMRWQRDRITDLLDWCRAFAAAHPELPEGFR